MSEECLVIVRLASIAALHHGMSVVGLLVEAL